MYSKELIEEHLNAYSQSESSTCSAPALLIPSRVAQADGTPPVTVPQMLKLYVKFCSTIYIVLSLISLHKRNIA